MLDIEDTIKENRKRIAVINSLYNPVTGDGCCGKRKRVSIKDAPLETMFLPETMIRENRFVRLLVKHGMKGYIERYVEDGDNESFYYVWIEFIKVRIRYDFEYWAYSFIMIRKKGSSLDIPFMLNRAQRTVLPRLEEMRLAGEPIKFILVKARQWGGSTLIQIYMLWIQLVHRRNWNSVICGDVESQSRNVRAMITKALEGYPSYLLDGPVRFVPFEGSNKNRIIENTQCVVSIGSAQKPDTLRSGDISGAHLTEVGLWKSTKEKTPEDLVQSIVGSIYDTAYSFLGIESTAKGVGNYFHRTWIQAVNGENNLLPIFKAWFEIDIYSRRIKDYRGFIESMSEYEEWLWSLGATLEAICWYRKKSSDMADEWRMHSEFPSTPEEAFQSTGRRRFRMRDVMRLRKGCMNPVFTGDISGLDETGRASTESMELHKDEKGFLRIWRMPDNNRAMLNRYVVSMDVGGTSDQADWTDIVLFDRYWMTEAGVPEVVAEWHGHLDHDQAAWKAVQLCRYYTHGNDMCAMLVIESNTLETEGTEGNNFEYILDEIADEYENLYCRTSPERIRQGAPAKWGFHTNTSTKPMVISHMAKALRCDMYIEREVEAANEMDVFEIKPDGKTMGAVDGMHDDRVMARAIGIWVCYHIDIPAPMETNTSHRSRRILSEATI